MMTTPFLTVRVTSLVAAKKRQKKHGWLVGYLPDLNSTILNFLLLSYLYVRGCTSRDYPSCFKRQVAQFKTTNRWELSSFQAGKRTISSNKLGACTIHTWMEIDSHADTIVCGANCIILHYIGKECGVLPYMDEYIKYHPPRREMHNLRRQTRCRVPRSQPFS
jgi:hypothetical protein